MLPERDSCPEDVFGGPQRSYEKDEPESPVQNFSFVLVDARSATWLAACMCALPLSTDILWFEALIRA
jgi:hypothetical protein